MDDLTWTRGRGWALWKTLANCWYILEDVNEFEQGERILGAILEE